MSSPIDIRRASASGLSYAAVAGRKSPPSNKHNGDPKTQSHSEDLKKSPRQVFAVRNKQNGATPANSSPKNEGSMSTTPAPGGTAQHQYHRKKGNLRKKKQLEPSTSSITHPPATHSGKSVMPEQENNTTVDSQHSQPPSHSPGQKNGGQQTSAALMKNQSNQKNINREIDHSKLDQTSTRVSVQDPALQQGDHKSATDAQRIQNNQSTVASLSSVAGAHHSDTNKPSAQYFDDKHSCPSRPTVKGSSGASSTPKNNGTQTTQFSESALVQNLKKRIDHQEADITHYTEQLYGKSKEFGSMRARISQLEKDLKQKDDDLIKARMRHMKLIEKDGQIKQLENRCTTLEALLEECQPLVEHCKVMIEARDLELVNLRAEATKLRTIIQTGIISIADLYGPQAASEFTSTASQKANKPDPTYALSMTPTGSGSPRMPQSRRSKAELATFRSPSKFNNSPLKNEQQPHEEVSNHQGGGSEDPFVQGSAGSSPVSNVVPSFSPVLEVNRQEPIHQDVGEHDNEESQTKGNDSWADEVQQQEDQKEQPESPKDVASADELAQPQGSRESSKNDIKAQVRELDLSNEKFLKELKKSRDDLKPASPTKSPSSLSSKAPGLLAPPRDLFPGPQQQNDGERHSVSQLDRPFNGTRGSHAHKLAALYNDRKRHNQTAPRTSNSGKFQHHKVVVDDDNADEDEGWTSVKTKAKPGYQSKARDQQTPLAEMFTQTFAPPRRGRNVTGSRSGFSNYTQQGTKAFNTEQIW
ncbi:hypothetical protein F5X99DRAFT_404842 [Biscogniauxia marginata]|nr:hypothetical protein F5X99DRAFT_404842 [Biscogniauxia marginata]